MRERRLIALVILCAGVAVTLLISTRLSGAARAWHDPDNPPPIYNPYPPGILPSDLNSEIARVIREVDDIESEALAQLRALPPPTLTGQPPILAHTGQRANVLLGKVLNFDKNMSPFQTRACAFCHMPYAGFSGPIPSVNLTMVAYPGSVKFRAGKRTAQRYTYSPEFPVLNFNTTQAAFFGGNFWDSRATGYLLGSPDANQAQGPPVDTQEHALPDTACIAFRLESASYKSFFEQIWGDELDIKFPSNTEEICETPGGASVFGTDTMPIKLSPEDRARANDVYDHWGQSLDQYEASSDVSAYSSKFDAFLKGTYTLTTDEMAGYKLFHGKANCNSCHLDGRSTAPTPPPLQGELPNSVDTGAEANTRPTFTCFGSSNLGVPLNPRDAIYYQNKPDSFGFTANPFGFGFRDLGLGTFLRSGPGSWASPNDEWTQFAPTSDGKMQTSSARNVAMTPPQCPTTEAGHGPYFQKEFFHNGYIKSLKQLVHFYNTRDVYPFNVTSGNCPAGKIEKVNCWPRPEVKNNLDMTIGMLGLSDTEENQLVAFLQTLTDGFTTPYPDINKFTGMCATGGTAATQGNEVLIKTPPLPPCASAICGVAPLPTMPIP
jgi:cytochrome c peroxidase